MPYFHKDFTGRTLINEYLNGQYITGSCFSQEKPDTQVFPKNMSGVTFVNCNLDNCFIPDSNTVIDCTTRKFSVQNDLNDWELDSDGKPHRLFNYAALDKLGISQPSPKDIPSEPVKSPIDYTDVARNVRV